MEILIAAFVYSSTLTSITVSHRYFDHLEINQLIIRITTVDGFYVAKFKVMKKTKKTEAAADNVNDDEDVVMGMDGDDDDIERAANATFNDEEDEALIKGERHLI
jgi:hypothetical protein